MGILYDIMGYHIKPPCTNFIWVCPKKMESQIHGHPIVDHNFRPHSRKLGYPPFLDKAMWVKNLRLMEPHGICGRKGVGNFECVEKNSLFRIWKNDKKNDKEWTMTSISTSFNAEDMWGLDSFEPHQLASTHLLEDGEHQLRGLAKQGLCGLQRQLLPTEARFSVVGDRCVWGTLWWDEGWTLAISGSFHGKAGSHDIFDGFWDPPILRQSPFLGGWWRTIINVGSTESTQILHCYPRLLLVRNSVGLECPLLTHTWLLAIWQICLPLYIYIYILLSLERRVMYCRLPTDAPNCHYVWILYPETSPNPSPVLGYTTFSQRYVYHLHYCTIPDFWTILVCYFLFHSGTHQTIAAPMIRSGWRNAVSHMGSLTSSPFRGYHWRPSESVFWRSEWNELGL